MKKLLLFLFTNIILSVTAQNVNITDSPFMMTKINESDTAIQNVIPDATRSDMFLGNIQIPDETGGTIPIDLIKIPDKDKVYVYGKKRILIMDTQSNSVTDEIDISNRSQYWHSYNNSLMDANENRFAYDQSTDMLYCCTEDLEIIAINTEDNSWETVVQTPGEIDDPFKYDWCFLKFDSRTNKIYWVVTHNLWGTGSDLFIYDATNYQEIKHLFFNQKMIYDIAVDDEKDNFYLSLDKEFRIYNTDNYAYSLINKETYDQAGDLLYINENNIHKLFCFTRTYKQENTLTYVVDLDHNNMIGNFPSPLPTESACYYDPEKNEVYVGYEPYDYFNDDFYIIDPNNYNIINSINTNIFTDNYINFCLDISTLNNQIIAAKTNEIVAINKSDLSVQQIKQGVHNEFARTVSTDDKSYVIGSLIGNINIINNAMSMDNSIEVGAQLFYGCYNTISKKAYFYNNNDLWLGNCKVYILNTLTNDINIVPIGDNISDVVFDPFTNQVFVSTYNESQSIKIIDGNTDELLDESDWVNLSHSYCASMLVAPNNKLYCIVGMDNNHGAGIEIRDGNNDFSLLNYHTYNVNSYQALWGDFCYNSFNGNVYATAMDLNMLSNNFGKLTEIDGTTNSCTDYNIGDNPFKIICNPVENKVYVQHINIDIDDDFKYISVFRCEDKSIGQIQIGHPVFDIEFDNNNNIVYALYNEAAIGRIGFIYDESLELGYHVPKNSISLKYNPSNLKLYVYTPFNGNNDDESEIWECYGWDTNGDGHLDDTETTRVPLENKNIDKFQGGLFNNTMLIDPATDKLYVANGGFSNISVIQCSNEQAVYFPGYNWISFPKLDRQNNDPVDAQTLLSGIDPFPNELALGNLPPQTESEIYLHYSNDNGWTGNLNNIQSTRGYKLELPDESNSYTLEMTGTRLDPFTPIDVYAGYENWVGYFLQQSLSPMDAFSDLLPDLEIARGYDWTLMNWSMSANNPVWMVVPEGALIKYGDMAVVTVTTDRSFQWYQYGQRSASGQLPQPEYFSYTEQADYTPIIIQLDGEDQPEEIGAFVNDTCIGACTVKPTDTLVLVRGYMEGEPDDSVSFRMHYSAKSTGKTVKEYFVYNREKQISEKRSIKVGENKPFYLVSFSGAGKMLLSGEEPFLDVYPNPASGQINISFVLPEEGDVTIEVFDLIGRIVYRQDDMNLPEGRQQLTLNTSDLMSTGQSSGLYFVKINAPGVSGTAKLIVK